MSAHTAEWIWLDARQTLGVAELAKVSGISATELDELIEYGALTPVAKAKDERQFQADCVTTLRAAGKLKNDYDLDLFAVALLIDQLRRIETLEAHVRLLQARAPLGGLTPD